jgi:predicted O-methyltransferase YrrM
MHASNRRGHGIHSPFVYHFVIKVLDDPPSEKKKYHDIERTRKDFKRSGEKIPILDFGAGSYKNKSAERKVSSLVQTAAKPARFGRLFHRVVTYYGIDSVLELGTSLGMSTRYFAKGLPHGIVHSIEGAPGLAEFTQTNLAKGEFSAVLPHLLTQMRGRKMIYIDGNHRYAPTISYFHEVLKCIGTDDILIFDDVHWSKEMEKAWEEIKNDKQVSCTIDLFFIGIVFFRKEFKEKCSFSFRF